MSEPEAPPPPPPPPEPRTTLERHGVRLVPSNNDNWAVTDRQLPTENAEQLAAELRALGHRADVVHDDATDQEQARVWLLEE